MSRKRMFIVREYSPRSPVAFLTCAGVVDFNDSRSAEIVGARAQASLLGMFNADPDTPITCSVPLYPFQLVVTHWYEI